MKEALLSDSEEDESTTDENAARLDEHDERIRALRAEMEERFEEMMSRQDSMESRQDALSRRLEHQQAKLDAVARKATYNAVTGGTRKAQRKKKVLSELHYRAEQDAEGTHVYANGRVSVKSDDIESIADVSQQTANRYARELADEVQGVRWEQFRTGWYTRGKGKVLKFNLAEFCDGE